MTSAAESPDASREVPLAPLHRMRRAALGLGSRVRAWNPWFRRVVLGMIVYTVAYSAIAILKFATFNTYAWDLGIYNQVMWSLVTGHGFQYTPEYFINPSGNYMAQHFAPDLLLLAPFYALFPGPITLLVIQSFVVALGAYPVWLLSRFRGLSPRASGCFALSYLVFLNVWGVNWYDFHLETFLVPAMLFAMYFWMRRRWAGFWIALLVGLFTLESAAFFVASLGATLALVNGRSTWSFVRRPRLRPVEAWMPLLVVAASVLYFVAVRQVQHALNPVIPPMFEEVYRASDRWAILGISDPLNPIALLSVLVLHPDRFLAALAFAFPAKLIYLSSFVVPLLLLPLRKPWWLLPSAPWCVGLLLSDYAPYYSFGYQYTAFLLPWFYVAAILAFDPGPRWARSPRPSPYPFRDFPARVSPRGVASAPLVYTTFLVLLVLASPSGALGGTVQFGPGLASPSVLPTAHSSAVWALVGLIPPDASVVTQSNLFPQVSSREDAYVVPYVMFVADAWALTVDHLSGPIRFVLLDPATDRAGSDFMMTTIVGGGGYGLRARAGTAVLYEWGYWGAVQIVPE